MIYLDAIPNFKFYDSILVGDGFGEMASEMVGARHDEIE